MKAGDKIEKEPDRRIQEAIAFFRKLPIRVMVPKFELGWPEKDATVEDLFNGSQLWRRI
ncbi:hypothetical protein [Rhizobium gallicum]|uniref:hypothetical protein n=1 Tax=Rhizobium gallicum TaxID=56730 RepID=UPI001416F4D7